MAFDGTEGSLVDINDASAWTAEFRRNNSSQKKAYFFGREKIEDLLAQTGAKGIRIYFGEDQGVFKLILVAAETDEDDIIGDVLDNGVPCPTNCGSNNALNS